jgi:hypothetical protein
MSKLPPHLQLLADDLPPRQRADIEEAISSSPQLLSEISRAEREGLVKHLQMSAPNSNDGGHYDGSTKTIVIGEEAFTTFPRAEHREKRLDVLTSTIGHETEHAFQTRERGQVIQDMRYQMQEALRDAPPGGTVDITTIAGAYLNKMRQFEADAEIAGWQAAGNDGYPAKPVFLTVVHKRYFHLCCQASPLRMPPCAAYASRCATSDCSR